MTQELEERLFDKYSSIIKPDPAHMRNLMDFGCECGVGWYNLIDEALGEITKLPDLPKDFEIFQIKEKFGELRIYTNNSTEEIETILEKASTESYHICESCGMPAEGPTREFGWVKNLCEACKVNMRKKNTQHGR